MWLSTKRKSEKISQSPSIGSIADDWQSSLPLDWTRVQRNCRRRGHARSKNRAISPPEQLLPNGTVGQAIFCLHDLDPHWFQGYFVPRGSKKPTPMLAVQKEVDDCMACSAGGYRRLSLTIYNRRVSATNTNANDTKPLKIEDVDWTGGDMMTLYHPQHVEMVGERLFTVSMIR